MKSLGIDLRETGAGSQSEISIFRSVNICTVASHVYPNCHIFKRGLNMDRCKEYLTNPGNWLQRHTVRHFTTNHSTNIYGPVNKYQTEDFRECY
jgi:hypothetical protein